MNEIYHEHLPKELKELVRNSVSLLGDVIKEEGGTKLFESVEKIRLLMIKYRKSKSDQKEKDLNELYEILECRTKKQKHEIAHAYTLMLELINTCEAAFRTFKLRKAQISPPKIRQDNKMVYVLTAHPTEARTPQNIALFQRIQNVLIRILDKSGEEDYMHSIIKHNLKIAWLLPITRHEKPKVVDEANHLFSIICRDDIFDTILRADRDYGNIRIRTWVGGDKDGHPGVDEKVMIKCLQASRNHFIRILLRISSDINKDVKYLENHKLEVSFETFKENILKCHKIKNNDSENIKNLKRAFKNFTTQYKKVVGDLSPRIGKTNSIFNLFPSLVIPLELREDSEIILSGLKANKPIAIERMLMKIAEISKGADVRGYAQGFIISMCHSYEDFKNAKKLAKRALNHLSLPIIPLFETAEALEDSTRIVEQILEDKPYIEKVKSKWNNRLEVMLGYSDSSKGMGVLPSRIAIAKTIRALDVTISNAGVVPIFFHGSGGSVDRGGGSLSDQTAWWPSSALNTYKATIQGEMVERNFTSPEVSISGINKILDSFNRANSKKGMINIDTAVEEFAVRVKTNYEQKIKDPSFFHMVEAATPYSYLSVLKLGSRPSKRAKAKKLDLGSIRAIPWILCWTQTRTLFPTWWGVGSAWSEVKEDASFVKKLEKSYEESSLFSSYIRILGFTLSKIDLNVFAIYLAKSKLDSKFQEEILSEFREEYKNTLDFFHKITKEKDLLWYRPWLGDSIELRSSMIHPLNMLQIMAYNQNDEILIRKTVAGISSGMMTTG